MSVCNSWRGNTQCTTMQFVQRYVERRGETTFMRYGHGQSGVTRLTLKPETVKSWAYHLHQLKLITKKKKHLERKTFKKKGKRSTTTKGVHKSPWSRATHRGCERCYRGKCDSSSSQCQQCSTSRKEADDVIWRQWACCISHQNLLDSYSHVGDEKTHQSRRHEGVWSGDHLWKSYGIAVEHSHLEHRPNVVLWIGAISNIIVRLY